MVTNIIIPLSITLSEVRTSNMYYKTSFESEIIEFDYLRPRFSPTAFPERVLLPRGISSEKKNGIINCLKGVPKAKLCFWTSLIINEESRDLAAFIS